MLFVPIFIRIAIQDHLYADVASAPPAEAVAILGASVIGGELSGILAARADIAIEAYRAGKARKILVTGDNGNRYYHEVDAVFAYLTMRGIPQKDIYLDRAGFDTYSSIYRARHIFGARTLLIATQDFHLPRAVFLARALGIDANGVVAAGGSVGDYLREIPATAKAILNLMMQRQPLYLGAPIPLGGASNAQAMSARLR
jgi:SanA protein